MTDKAQLLYDEISEIDQEIGDLLDDSPLTALTARDEPDLDAAHTAITTARTALRRVAARLANWLPANDN